MQPTDLVVKRSSAGLGLFSNQAFKKEDFVIEYTGEKITVDEADERGGKYLFTLNDTTVIDGKDRDNTARYINHSCKPNCEPEIDEDDWKIIIRACKKIKPGEELTYDYGKEYVAEHITPYGCKCSACVK
jgi:SET domain-containing protein